MEVIRGFIPVGLLQDKNIPTQSKLIYYYLAHIALGQKAKDGIVQIEITSTQVADFFKADKRVTQHHMKALLDTGWVGRVMNGSVPNPILFLEDDPDSEAPFKQNKDGINEDSPFVEDSAVKKILGRWNQSHNTEIKYIPELKTLIRKLLEDCTMDDILIAIDNHSIAIKDDKDYWNHSSQLFFRDNLKVFLNSSDNINTWRNKNKSERERNNLTKFHYT